MLKQGQAFLQILYLFYHSGKSIQLFIGLLSVHLNTFDERFYSSAYDKHKKQQSNDRSGQIRVYEDPNTSAQDHRGQ